VTDAGSAACSLALPFLAREARSVSVPILAEDEHLQPRPRHSRRYGRPDGKLTRNDAAAAARAAGIEPGPAHGAVELLLLLGIAIGILRADGLRVRAAPLHDAWRVLDDTLRARARVRRLMPARDVSTPSRVVYPGLSGGELLDPCASRCGYAHTPDLTTVSSAFEEPAHGRLVNGGRTNGGRSRSFA